MRVKKREGLFAVLCLLMTAAALVYVFVGARSIGPVVEEESFPVTFHYEHRGRTLQETVNYQCGYTDSGRWVGYFENSGGEWAVYVEEDNGTVWTIDLRLEPGYLMGDEAYADFYAEGMPVPTISYYDMDTGEEFSGRTEVESLQAKVLGCEYPVPIPNEIVDRGVEIDGTACGVLTAMAYVLLLLSMVLLRKEPGQGENEVLARVFTLLVGILGVPVILLLSLDTSAFPDGMQTVLRLIPVLTALCAAASVVLRHRGKDGAGLGVLFVGPAAFLLAHIFLWSGMGGVGLFYPAGIAAGAAIALGARPAEHPEPNSLALATRICSICLIPVYAVLCLPSVVLAGITDTSLQAGPGTQILAVVVAVLAGAAPLYCGVGLGLSAALGKKGRGRAAFRMQFAGFAGIAFSLLVLVLGDLIPGISISIN